MAKRKAKKTKRVDALTHDDAKRPNLPSAEYQDALDQDVAEAIEVAYERRNRDLDPQLVWRGKDVIDPADLVVQAPPLFIQEKVHPKVLIDDLLRRSRHARQHKKGKGAGDDQQLDLFADFNGLAEEAAATEFYQHEANWTNRMILGDSLHVMASLADREQLRGKVQCIYIDPPYGIKFNSNFQWSTTSRDVKDGKQEHITRDPEMVKAFRDTWRDGIHSYLSYLRDRLTVARDLLTESGSIFVQIGDENVHRVRAVMDEVFGVENFCSLIAFQKTSGSTTSTLPTTHDYVLFYAKNLEVLKYRKFYKRTTAGESGAKEYKRVEVTDGEILPIGRFAQSGQVDLPAGAKVLTTDSIVSKGGDDPDIEVWAAGRRVVLSCKPNRHWKTQPEGIRRLWKIGRLLPQAGLRIYKRYFDDFPCRELPHVWNDTRGEDDPSYVVQTHTKVVARCLLMTTDPGDLVLDPTCGSGTTAAVAEQWGRRWITIDTSRVALALARARIMGAKYPWYLLADSPEGQKQVAEITGRPPKDTATSGNVRQGFVYERVPHITLGAIANNAEIDVLCEKHEEELEPLRGKLTQAVGADWLESYRADQDYDIELPAVIQEWEVPRELPEDWPEEAEPLHEEFWWLRIQRQQEIDDSIARNAEFEYLYDQPYEDKSTVRVAGPFTVESMMPHREVALDEDDRPIEDAVGGDGPGPRTVPTEHADFAEVILEHLKSAGVQQAHKEDRIEFSSLTPWPGKLVCAEGRYQEGDDEDAPQKRAGIFIGPEFGSVMRQDLDAAADEAADAGFDVLIACAFAYGPHAADVKELGGLQILKARMNADLHMSKELADTGKGNLFVIFGEPDIEIRDAQSLDGGGSDDLIQVEIHGVDVFKPQSGKVVSDNRDGIACWMIDTDYNGQSFFVRHAYFLGQNDPYKSLKTSLKAEIDKDAWASLNSPISRPFPKPESGRIAVKVINHLGDEVMKVYRVE